MVGCHAVVQRVLLESLGILEAASGYSHITCIAFPSQAWNTSMSWHYLLPGAASLRTPSVVLWAPCWRRAAQKWRRSCARNSSTRQSTRSVSRRPAAPMASDISQECVVRCIRSFARGAAPGPPRPACGFMRQTVGPQADRPCVPVIVGVASCLLMDLLHGRCPRIWTELVAQLWAR